MLDAADAAWPDVAAHLDAGDGLAVLPFGAFEQHGPHLPLSTDTVTASALARALAGRFDALLLPAVPYGDTWNNAGYRGTISLSTSTVTAIATDVGRALAASGARGFVIVNGDWGNRMPLYAAARALGESTIPTIVLDYPGMDDAVAGVRESRPAADGLNHAEEVETSLMLHLAPRLVRQDRYLSAYPVFPDDFGIRPMQLHPFSPSGVFGDPTTSSAEKGATILSAVTDAASDVLRDFVAALPPR